MSISQHSFHKVSRIDSPRFSLDTDSKEDTDASDTSSEVVKGKVYKFQMYICCT